VSVDDIPVPPPTATTQDELPQHPQPAPGKDARPAPPPPYCCLFKHPSTGPPGIAIPPAVFTRCVPTPHFGRPGRGEGRGQQVCPPPASSLLSVVRGTYLCGFVFWPPPPPPVWDLRPPHQLATGFAADRLPVWWCGGGVWGCGVVGFFTLIDIKKIRRNFVTTFLP